jgi:nucleoside-diphosphate-sugar epimerase
VARAAREAGLAVAGTARERTGFGIVAFDRAASEIEAATHLLSTVPPGMQGDPVLDRYGVAIATAPRLRWIGYFSSTAVYGDRGGAWVDEDTQPAPNGNRGRRRLAAEARWSAFANRIGVDIFRLAGVYGPGRSAFDDLRAGRARRIIKPGHAFGRIHRDDIVAAVLVAMRKSGAGRRILNLADDEPTESAVVVAEAARLLGIAVPPALPFEDAEEAMSAMVRSFWADNRKVASAKTKTALGIGWRYPTYRDGLSAILTEEGNKGPA